MSSQTGLLLMKINSIREKDAYTIFLKFNTVHFVDHSSIGIWESQSF